MQPLHFQQFMPYLKIGAVFFLFLLVCFNVFNPVMAQDRSISDDEDWPDEVEERPYNQTPSYYQKTTNPIVNRYQMMEQEAAAQRNNPNAPPPAKPLAKKPGLFKRVVGTVLGTNKKPQPLSESQIISVGPRLAPPVTDPLLAMPVSIQLEDGKGMPTGFYIIRQRQDSPTQRTWELVKENKVFFTCLATRITDPLVNNDSPLSPANPLKESALTPIMEAKVSAFNANVPQTVVLILKEQGVAYQSTPLPIVSDKRPLLRPD